MKFTTTHRLIFSRKKKKSHKKTITEEKKVEWISDVGEKCEGEEIKISVTESDNFPTDETNTLIQIEESTISAKASETSSDKTNTSTQINEDNLKQIPSQQNMVSSHQSNYASNPEKKSSSRCPFSNHMKLTRLDTNQKQTSLLSEQADKDKPRHTVGCTPYECHGSMMEKRGFDFITSDDVVPEETKIKEATIFLMQYAKENNITEDIITKRIENVTDEILTNGTYKHTFEELEYGCRLAWRNTGRCILRKMWFRLELRDCRDITTAEDCFREVVEHLKYAANGGSIKPVISVFHQKPDGKSSPVRIWNPQLIGYAGYKTTKGPIIGDPARLEFTALCVKMGWNPPKVPSDFDVLPLLISDETTTHSKPKVFVLPNDAILEVELHHPNHDFFYELNLRWYAIPALSSMGIDIGGVLYQTCPFNGWYQITEIARDILDVQRYNLADAVATVCDIERTKANVWKDDVQLQVHKAIMHSFATHGISIVDHHTASDLFVEFHRKFFFVFIK